ncbi:hypothetical protein ACFX2J_027533 [Malus domestica]
MTTWFLGLEPVSWFIPPEYIDRKKQEFTQLKQGKMTTNEYYRRFTDFSHYHLEEFYEILLRIKDLENMPNESEDEKEKNGIRGKYDKGKGQFS